MRWFKPLEVHQGGGYSLALQLLSVPLPQKFHWAGKNNLLGKPAIRQCCTCSIQRHPISRWSLPRKSKDSKASFLNTSVIPQGIKAIWKAEVFSLTSPHILDSSSPTRGPSFFFFFQLIKAVFFDGALSKIFCLNSDQFYIAFSSVKALSYIILCFKCHSKPIRKILSPDLQFWKLRCRGTASIHRVYCKTNIKTKIQMSAFPDECFFSQILPVLLL